MEQNITKNKVKKIPDNIITTLVLSISHDIK